jgi:cytochrome c biogenesis protein CcdA/thiol-disulfide isomerase/thioredoxin
MELLILFAFLAGVVTIVSPCVLPVLPILLSTSTGGGRLRPVGIVLGLAATFTVVTLAVTAAAQAFAVPATWLRIAAIVALGFFGLTLLVPPLRSAVERALSPLTRLAGSQAHTGRSGIGGGLVIGAGLGLLWAPCVGPIMASVIGLTALAGITPEALGITLAYSLGAAVPMLAVAYGGRRLASKARRAGSRTGVVQQLFGGLTLAACVALLLGADIQLQTFVLRGLPAEWNAALTSFERQEPVRTELDRIQSNATGEQQSGQMASVPVQAAAEATEIPVPPEPTATTLSVAPEPTTTSVPPTETPKPAVALKNLGPAPELAGITGWINSEPLSIEGLKGKVVIIDFWTFGCYNCANTRPYVRALYDKYRDQGLEIIGVHTPEFAYERVRENIEKAAKQQDVNWPIAMDPDFKTWSAYDNHYWPAFYFIDAEGRIRYTHIGEGNYDKNELVVQQLLAEAKEAAAR